MTILNKLLMWFYFCWEKRQLTGNLWISGMTESRKSAIGPSFSENVKHFRPLKVKYLVSSYFSTVVNGVVCLFFENDWMNSESRPTGLYFRMHLFFIVSWLKRGKLRHFFKMNLKISKHFSTHSCSLPHSPLSSEWLWSTHTWTGPGVSVRWKVSTFLPRSHPRQIKGGWHIIYASLKGEPFSRGPAARQFASPLLWSNDFLLIERSQSNAGPFCALLCSVQKGFFSVKLRAQASAHSRGSPP